MHGNRTRLIGTASQNEDVRHTSDILVLFLLKPPNDRGLLTLLAEDIQMSQERVAAVEQNELDQQQHKGDP